MFEIYFSLSYSNIVKVVNYDIIDYVAETYIFELSIIYSQFNIF